ncbi:Ig-like domain-containing protein [Cryobacterium sp. SO2]|uniref:beta strand repeat-containing protein n=1 Tax=Cryobacterium sp. SO2 TaxID=1897060 RepID=UPI0023DA5E22|nr:Ig-like domain-containing protein [Cryobacterium sp. SO2]WEO77970.1 Ig-like domain-containing protein [Cryobacterium sp. SO2]
MNLRAVALTAITALALSLGWPGVALAAPIGGPTATVVMNDTSLIVNETSTVTFVFSEAVSDFENNDLIVENGTLSEVTRSDIGINWSATFTPTVGTTDATNRITLDLEGVVTGDDTAGTGVTYSNNYAIDTQRPTATIVLDNTALTDGTTSLVTITFAEAVVGFNDLDLVLGTDGSLSGVVSTDGGTTWTATFRPMSNREDVTNTISLNGAGVTDLSGNAGTGTFTSANFMVDTLRPTGNIVVADGLLIAGETSLVTLTFSEAVTGFDNSDLTVENGSLSPVASADGGITWTATFTPTSGVTDTANLFALSLYGVSDLSGNTGQDTVNSANYAIDTVRPTASVVIDASALHVDETSAVTITFSEAVTGFDNADLTVENGSLTAVTSTDGGLTWTATLTPTSGVTDATNLITLGLAGVTGASGNAGTGSAVSSNFRVLTERPTATVVVADDALGVGESTTVTITFPVAVTDFTTTDISFPNASLTRLRSLDRGVTWTATLTATSGVTDASNVVTVDLTGVWAATSGNQGVGSAVSNNYAVDTVRPTATVLVDDTALAAGETSSVTITFSEPVTGFDNTDLTAANGTLSDVESSDGGLTWTATLTPTSAVTDTTNVITLALTGVSDAAANAGTGSADSNNYQVATVRPTATVVVADDTLALGETSSLTITFSTAVTGLTTDDISYPKVSLSGLGSSDGGITWTATLTPKRETTDTTNVITVDLTGVREASGNTGFGTAASNNYIVDTDRPSASVVLADTSFTVGETSTVTITFSEAVTGFDNADLTAGNGTLSEVSSTDGGLTWTATFTPTDDVTAGVNTVLLLRTGVTDLAGNTGAGKAGSANYMVDTQRPTASVVVDEETLTVGATSLITITFSEAVTGFTFAGLTVGNGTVSDLTSADGGTTYTATLTPADGVTQAANLIALDLTGVTDAAGNTGSGVADSNSYVVDTESPTATVVLGATVLLSGETASVTVTFSEAVPGLSAADLTVANGTISGLASADSGTTYTGTFTPTAGITVASNLITLDLAGITDAAGNAGSGSADSANYAIDTERPTAIVVLAQTELAAGESSPVTVTFSEAVTGFDNADLTVANGVLSDVSSTDGGLTFMATFTPADDVTAAMNVITLDQTGVSDQAGNTGSGTVGSANYAVDTALPTATVVVADDTLTLGDTSLVTITFSEAVTGLTVADLTIANARVSNGTGAGVSSDDGGTTWTGTLTPMSATIAAANLITLDLAGVTDAAGNAGSGTIDSNSYAIDTMSTPTPEPTPTPAPTPEPSAPPTPTPSSTPTPTAPTSTPEPSATPKPTATPTPPTPVEPTPTPEPTTEPTPTPTAPSENAPKPTAMPVAPDETEVTPATEGKISLSAGTVAPGDPVTISGLVPNQWYFTWFFSTPTPTAWQLASAAGTVDITVPASLPAGNHRVIVQDAAGDVYGWAAVTVQSELSPATPTPTVQPHGGLAQTGIDAGTLVAAAGALLLAGLLMGGFTLRRRRRGESV